MSAYFFHLKLELYPSPTTDRHRNLDHHRTESQTFVPPPGFDVFKSSLPAHRSSKWASYSFSHHQSSSVNGARKPLQQPEVGAPVPSSTGSAPSHSLKRRSSREHLESHGDAVLLPERSLNLRRDNPTPPRSITAAKPCNETAAKDWRYDTVQIESIDMESKSKSSASGGLHTKGVYLPSDPKTTDVGWGVVHLYRDNEESNLLDEHATPRKGPEVWNKGEPFDPEKCTTLCILAVPSWMMPSDLLGFVGDQAREDVSHFRLIRTGRANKYMVLMKFRSARKAREWQRTYNGRLFSAAEPENCHVVFIRSVEFLSPDYGAGSATSNFPHNTNDPFTNGDAAHTTKGLSSKPLAPPPPNLLELPTCPVCLERMDETTGLLTILCQHVFHCACLEKWRGSGCPVCRYTHSPSYTFPYPRPSYDASGVGLDATDPLCSVCATTANLWICLICGNIGCGRYDSAHAYAHYEATSHCYAMDITTQHVWDYAGDGYVHRLIQSKPPAAATNTDPTSAEPPHSGASGPRHANEAFRAEGSDSVPREKMESMAAEYTYLLTSQLEGQRRYFEEQVERAADKAAQASLRADEAAASAAHARAEIAECVAQRDEAAAAQARAEAALTRSEQARAKFERLAREMSTALREEKTMAEGLLQRVRAADEREASATAAAERWKAEKAELEEMNRDLTIFISGQEKVRELAAQGEEVVDGSVSVPDPPAASGGAKKGKGKGRKK